LVFKKSGDENEDPQNNSNFVPGSIAWDTSGHTEHITQSRGTATFPAGATPPDFDSAINVSGDSVNGIDKVSPSLRYSETWIMPIGVAMSATFVEAVYTTTGTVNLNQFRAFKPGEALFMGARGQWQGDQPYVAVTFDFECRPNVTDYYGGGTIGQFPKEGWQYVWFLYETAPSNGALVRKPLHAYRETIYEKKDWSAMQIVSKPIAAAQSGLRPQVVPGPNGGLNV
jgi:hypothetical protein